MSHEVKSTVTIRRQAARVAENDDRNAGKKTGTAIGKFIYRKEKVTP